MFCKNCGTEFLEGIFCPECGTKNETSKVDNHDITSDVNYTAEEYQKAYNILSEYEQVEEEKMIITKLGWPNPDDIESRIRQRLDIYYKASALDIKTVAAKQQIEQMKRDIMEDYYTYQKKDGSLGAQKFWAIVFSILAVCFLFPLGIIGIIIGIVVIWAGWNAVSELKKTKKTLEELDAILRQL